MSLGVRVTWEKMGMIGLSGVVCLLCGPGKPPRVVLISMGEISLRGALAPCLWKGQQCFCSAFRDKLRLCVWK